MTQSARPKLASAADESPGSLPPKPVRDSADGAPDPTARSAGETLKDADLEQSTPHLERIVTLHLLGASDRLSAQAMAAYVSGWCSALDAIEEWIEFAPSLTAEERTRFQDLMRELRAAQAAALDEER